jgi:glutamine amidotransferase
MDANRSIAVVDYGVGNIGSICNMLKHIGVKPLVATVPADLEGVRGIVLPGVGHFMKAMERLSESGMAAALRETASRGDTPILGICLGMQLMCHSSEEGGARGLGLIDAEVKRFVIPLESALKVPHMGWSEVNIKREGTILGEIGQRDPRFYFVHSYFVECHDDRLIIGTSEFGSMFTSAFSKGNLIGVQFHPEKSHRYGVELFKRFDGLTR